MNNEEIRTHVKVEQVLKNWDTIAEGLKNKERLAFVYKLDDFNISIKEVAFITTNAVNDYIWDPDTALVRITFYDLPTEDL